MARVFKQTYSTPIPPGAERITLKCKNGKTRPAVRFPGPDGKAVAAPLTRDGERLSGALALLVRLGPGPRGANGEASGEALHEPHGRRTAAGRAGEESRVGKGGNPGPLRGSPPPPRFRAPWPSGRRNYAPGPAASAAGRLARNRLL